MSKISEKVTLTYFNGRGRAEASRLLLEDAGQPYEEIRNFNWPEEKKNRDKYFFNQVPRLTVGNFALVQSQAIIRFLARELGYYEGSNHDKGVIDMFAFAVDEIRDDYYKLIFGGKFDTDKDTFIDGRLSTWLSNTEYLFSKQKEGKHFVSGEKISFADFALYEQLIVVSYLRDGLLDKYPLLKAFTARIEARPRIAAYLKSGKRPWSVNGTELGTPKEFVEKMRAEWGK